MSCATPSIRVPSVTRSSMHTSTTTTAPAANDVEEKIKRKDVIAHIGETLKKVRIRYAECKHIQDGLNTKSGRNTRAVAWNFDRSVSDFRDIFRLVIESFCVPLYEQGGKPDGTSGSEEVVICYTKDIARSEFNLNCDEEELHPLPDVPNLKMLSAGKYKEGKSTGETELSKRKLFALFDSDSVNVPGMSRETHNRYEDENSLEYFLSILYFVPYYMITDLIRIIKEDGPAYWDYNEREFCSKQFQPKSGIYLDIFKKGMYAIEIPNFRQLIDQDENSKGIDTVPKPFLLEFSRLIDFVARTVKEILYTVCEDDKELIDRAFDDDRVKFDKKNLSVDGDYITWSEYDRVSAFGNR